MHNTLKLISDTRQRLIVILMVLSFHSLLVGLGLIFLPLSWLEFFGYQGYQGDFFQIQGGVFHLVMSLAYLLAGLNVDRYPGLIIFSIMAKGMATIFLFIYYFGVEPIWIVLLSALADGAMCGVLWWSYRGYLKGQI